MAPDSWKGLGETLLAQAKISNRQWHALTKLLHSGSQLRAGVFDGCPPSASAQMTASALKLVRGVAREAGKSLVLLKNNDEIAVNPTKRFGGGDAPIPCSNKSWAGHYHGRAMTMPMKSSKPAKPFIRLANRHYLLVQIDFLPMAVLTKSRIWRFLCLANNPCRFWQTAGISQEFEDGAHWR